MNKSTNNNNINSNNTTSDNNITSDNVNSIKSKSDVLPVAVTCPLSGAFLIEASAGTGKTWTLTGIILRLLIQKKIEPENIIATTFTRAAAQEIQERVHSRLQEFYNACLWLQNELEKIELTSLDHNERIAMIKNSISLASQEQKELQDSVNQYLLFWLVDSVERLDLTLIRIKVILSTLNKLFISTLDSFAQKILKEYASMIAEDSNKKQIASENRIEQVIDSLIHDKIRYIHTELYNDLSLYDLLDIDKLLNANTIKNKINNAIIFFGDEIDKPYNDYSIKSHKAYIKHIYDLVKEIQDYDYSDFNDDNAKELVANMKKNNIIRNKFYLFNEIKQKIDKLGVKAFSFFDNDHNQLIGCFNDKYMSDAFKKADDDKQYQWQQLPLDQLKKIKIIKDTKIVINEFYKNKIYYDVALYVRENLKAVLDESDETTHTLQMQKVINALNGKESKTNKINQAKAKKLAQYIRYKYPIALIDESQDINGEQAELIKNIYLNKQAIEDYKNDKGFLLLVGDPKQAIYRFRGGDVANYNIIKQSGLDTSQSLKVNRRSNSRLINALNQWFDDRDKTLSNFGDDIYYQKISAVNQDSKLSWQNTIKNNDVNDSDINNNDNNSDSSYIPNKPITILKDSLDDKLKTTAYHIAYLLNSNNTIDGRKIIPTDIAILAKARKDLFKLKQYLKNLGIKSIDPVKTSVFATEACNDLHGLFVAILEPNSSNISNLLLRLFNYTVDDVDVFFNQNNEQAYNEFLAFLIELKNIWQNKGLAILLNQIFAKKLTLKGVDNETIWEFLAKFNNSERYLTDMCQLFDILSVWRVSLASFLEEFEYHRNKDSERYQRLVLPTESGITLTTIHGSKGLEFNIVYIVGLDKDPNTNRKKGIYPYIDDNKRRLSILEDSEEQEGYFEEKDKRENSNEAKRLGYVALTRAAEQIFVVTSDKQKSDKNTLKEWGFFEQNAITIPSRLLGDIELIEIDDNLPICNYNELSLLTDRKMINQNWSEQLPRQYFKKIGNASFTSLVAYQNRPQKTIIRDNDEWLEPEQIIVSKNDDIRQAFMRGISAGVFLHKVLEVIDGNNNSDVFDKVSSKLGLNFDDEQLKQLSVWLDDVGNTPFLASNQALYAIDKKITELGFTMTVTGEMDTKKLEKLFLKYGNKKIKINNNYSLIAFLKGEIDLLYQNDGKYYIVDYKSNYLPDYSQQTMQQAMDGHGYWLQAAIYQVALHRLLSLKISDYKGNEKRYLGDVEYVFLRGIYKKESENFKQSLGRLVWSVPIPLIIALDEFFG